MASELTFKEEGKAKIIVPEDNEVFYNPIQCYNRDTSCFVIQEFSKLFLAERKEKEFKEALKGVKRELKHKNKSDEEIEKEQEEFKKNFAPQKKGIRILEALAATGLRSCRYAMELSDLDCIVANDLSAEAVEQIKKNRDLNGISENLLIPKQGDACEVLFAHRNEADQFDVVDLDPYGTAVPFIDGAVQAVSDGGLLAVTCTDMAVLSGNRMETCFAKYGSFPLHKDYCHEMALRILLFSLQSAASRHKRYIVPLISLSIDYYIRVFVRVYTSPKEVLKAGSKLSYIHQCNGCEAFYLNPLSREICKGTSWKLIPALAVASGNAVCPDCGSAFQMGGPMYSLPIHSTEFLDIILQRLKTLSEKDFATHKRMVGMLTLARSELADVPLYYRSGHMAATLHCSNIPMDGFRSALLNAGYRVSGTHACADAIKTDAPPSALWDIWRCWEKDHPVAAKRKATASPGSAILEKTPLVLESVDFSHHTEAKTSADKQGIVRFQMNPRANWGPQSRARPKRSGEPLENAQKKKKSSP